MCTAVAVVLDLPFPGQQELENIGELLDNVFVSSRFFFIFASTQFFYWCKFLKFFVFGDD